MCDKQLKITLMHYNLFLNDKRLKKCVIKLLILFLLQYNLFLNAIILTKCVIKQFIDVFFVFGSIPGQYKPEICDIVVSLYPFLKVYFPDNNKTISKQD